LIDKGSVVNVTSTNYFGDNIVVVGTGNIDHAAFVDQVNSAFASVGKDAVASKSGTEKAAYTPSLLFIRDDEMINSNVAVCYDAPSAKHEDFYAF
jgi:predicted Zn-dependent peptidase